MEYGRIKDYIKYKAEEQGIEVKLVKENYTSQTCPKCSKKHKPQGRNYICSCDKEEIIYVLVDMKLIEILLVLGTY